MKVKLILGMAALFLVSSFAFAGGRGDRLTPFSGQTEWGASRGHNMLTTTEDGYGRGTIPNAGNSADIPYLLVPNNPDARHRVGEPVRVRFDIVDGVITNVYVDAVAELMSSSYGIPGIAVSVATILRDNGTRNLLEPVSLSQFSAPIQWTSPANQLSNFTIDAEGRTVNLFGAALHNATLNVVSTDGVDIVTSVTRHSAPGSPPTGAGNVPNAGMQDTRRAMYKAANLALENYVSIGGRWYSKF